jgi:hypothetical protein
MARLFICLAFALAACGHDGGTIDRTIGAACTSNAQCDHTCFQNQGDFPGGFCSTGCASDNDCPLDTYCSAPSGGVCLFACPKFDCNRLGAGWGCHSVDHVGGGKVEVCIGN